MLDRRKYLTGAETDRLLAAAAANTTTPSGRRDLVLVTLGVNSGLRISELARLRRQDFGWDEGPYVDVLGSKRGASRRVWISAAVGKQVQRWIDTLPPNPAAPVFPVFEAGHLGRAMSTRNLAIRFTRIARRAGLHHSPHAMRHTFALAWYRSNRDIVSLKQQLGHRNLKTTQVYATVPDDVQRSHAGAFPALIPKRRLTSSPGG